MTLQETLQEYIDKKLPHRNIDSLSGSPYKLQNTYINAERMIAWSDFRVINMMRDVRGDDGDDGGFLVCLAEKHGEFYVIVLTINYNGNIDSHILHIILPENITDDNFEDFKCFSTIEEAHAFIIQLESDLSWCTEQIGVVVECDIESNNRYDGIYGGEFEFNGSRYVEEVEMLSEIYNKDWDSQYCNFINSCIFAYSEYEDGNCNRFYALTTEDNSEFYRIKNEFHIAELKTYIAELAYFEAKLKNPEMYKQYKQYNGWSTTLVEIEAEWGLIHEKIRR